MAKNERRGRLFQPAIAADELAQRVVGYEKLFDVDDSAARIRQASELTRTYYDLVTEFYEYGWGQSFHFATQAAGESFEAAISRHEHYLALRLGLGAGQRVVDLGCGVGGPMRAIARFSGASIVGINYNELQVGRVREYNEAQGLSDLCSVVHGDFTRVPLPTGSFDAAYAIEATCHAGDRRDVFAEAYRLVAPGGRFASYEWCLTDRYDDRDADHRRIRAEIEKGNALPDLVSTAAIGGMLRDVGFTVVDETDLAARHEPHGQPWYRPLEARASMKGFLHSRTGIWLTHQLVRGLERTGFSPKGTIAAHDVLRVAQRGLLAGGRTGIFTPMYFVLAEKPA